MGGGGGGGFSGAGRSIKEQLEAAKLKETEYLNSEINEFLQELLGKYNDRNVSETNEKLNDLKEALGENFELEKVLFGGSVAKHTYVDGLSDIDALVLMDKKSIEGLSSKKIIKKFCELIKNNFPNEDVTKGKLAITINYKDGTEIQLLPAIRHQNKIQIPDVNGNGWRKTNPASFQKKLTKENQKLNNQLVPTIKLAKSLISDLPKNQKITGYHLESLAVKAVKNYQGSNRPKDLLVHILKELSSSVKTKMVDKTGQSRHVDEYLGKNNSKKRKQVSEGMSALERQLRTATSVTKWKSIFGKNE